MKTIGSGSLTGLPSRIWHSRPVEKYVKKPARLIGGAAIVVGGLSSLVCLNEVLKFDERRHYSPQSGVEPTDQSVPMSSAQSPRISLSLEGLPKRDDDSLSFFTSPKIFKDGRLNRRLTFQDLSEISLSTIGSDPFTVKVTLDDLRKLNMRDFSDLLWLTWEINSKLQLDAVAAIVIDPQIPAASREEFKRNATPLLALDISRLSNNYAPYSITYQSRNLKNNLDLALSLAAVEVPDTGVEKRHDEADRSLFFFLMQAADQSAFFTENTREKVRAYIEIAHIVSQNQTGERLSTELATDITNNVLAIGQGRPFNSVVFMEEYGTPAEVERYKHKTFFSLEPLDRGIAVRVYITRDGQTLSKGLFTDVFFEGLMQPLAERGFKLGRFDNGFVIGTDLGPSQYL